jgi:hypothetical protein
VTSEKSVATEQRLNNIIANGLDSWNTLSLTNSWTGTLRYRQRIDNEVTLNGHIIAGTLNTTIGTLPTGYRAASVQQRMPIVVSPTGGGTPQIAVDTTGVVTIVGLAAGVTDVWINARFPLD